MSRIINARSPFFIKVSDTNLSYATIELYIYEGAYKAVPTSTDLKYTITKSTIGTNNYIVFEISELIRDYIEVQYNGEYDSFCVWVDAVITATNQTGGTITSPTITPDNSNQFIATEGYGYFEEGINPEPSRGLFQSNFIIYRTEDASVNIPIFAEGVNNVTFYNDGELVRTQTITDNGNTNQKIQYISSNGSSDYATYKERVFEDGGIFEDSVCLQTFLNSFDIGAFDEVWVETDEGTDIIKVNTLQCSKYEPIKVTFVNKFGALQDIWFDKKSIGSINIKSDSYNTSVIDLSNLTYNTNAHQIRTLSSMGNESIVMNTGYIHQSYNEVISQLMLSEQIWMTRLTDTEELVLPLKAKTQSIQYKTHVNDKLVNYSIEFDMAFDKINNIR
jgi:hypothetical protein